MYRIVEGKNRLGREQGREREREQRQSVGEKRKSMGQEN
jgi:hypothetical protein